MFLSSSNLGLGFVSLGPVSFGLVRLCTSFGFGLGWAKTDSGHFGFLFDLFFVKVF